MLTSITDLRQTNEWVTFLRSLGWTIEDIDGQKIFIRQFPLIGSIAKFQRPNFLPDFQKLDEVAKRHRILFIKIEPKITIDDSSLKPQKLEIDNWPFLPSRTIHIDLTELLEEIFDSLSKNARYSIKKAEKECRTLISDFKDFNQESEEYLKQFHWLLKKVSRKKHFPASSYKELSKKVKAFGQKAVLISASNRSGDNNVIAAALILFSDNAAFYHHAASSQEGKKLFAPYIIMWEAIKLAKNRGAKVFDLEGIYDERYPQTTKNWEKFTVFKKKFGGRIVEYPGVFVKYYNPIARILFRMF